MASLEFETEKNNFRSFYEDNRLLLNDAKSTFVTMINSLIINDSGISSAKVEGRVKDKEESIKKFSRKYRSRLEEKDTPYEIKEYITDLIGIRIICLYEDDIEKLSSLLREHFDVIDETDKIAELESTEAFFGYKGLHLDLKINDLRKKLPEYQLYSDLNFEIQIRTIIQDSWSVLDHKIKYKKSIPNELKRRINILAALFELADREFREIRDSTRAEIQKAEEDDTPAVDPGSSQKTKENTKVIKLNAFNFLKIGGHFFNGHQFGPSKVDGFVQEIHKLSKGITKSTFHRLINKNISKIKIYKEYLEQHNPKEEFTPYIVICHCLYLGDKKTFKRALTNTGRKSFNDWLSENP